MLLRSVSYSVCQVTEQQLTTTHMWSVYNSTAYVSRTHNTQHIEAPNGPSPIAKPKHNMCNMHVFKTVAYKYAYNSSAGVHVHAHLNVFCLQHLQHQHTNTSQLGTSILIASSNKTALHSSIAHCTVRTTYKIRPHPRAHLMAISDGMNKSTRVRLQYYANALSSARKRVHGCSRPLFRRSLAGKWGRCIAQSQRPEVPKLCVYINVCSCECWSCICM